MLDEHLANQLSASRLKWRERPTSPEWHEWLAETARVAYRGRAPAMPSIRIHSLPGCLWEVLADGGGSPCLIADDELTASLAELRLLSLGVASPDAGYDKSALLLADAFRACGDFHRYALCLGWALPRAAEIHALRLAAFRQPGSSAETMVVMLHELAHRVLAEGSEHTTGWREIGSARVAKIVEALSEGELRDKALADSVRLGLSAGEAEHQLKTYKDQLLGNEELLEELTCDLLAVLAFLNLNSSSDVIAAPEAGPAGMSTKQVGDALLVAHGAIQNMQSLVAVQTIAATVAAGTEAQGAVPDRTGAELTARSTVLVSIITNLLQAWVEGGHLSAEWTDKRPNAGNALLRAIWRRNEARSMNLLDPLQDLDSLFHDPERFALFERDGLARLTEANVVWPGRIKPLDEMRWALTMVRA